MVSSRLCVRDGDRAGDGSVGEGISVFVLVFALELELELKPFAKVVPIANSEDSKVLFE